MISETGVVDTEAAQVIGSPDDLPVESQRPQQNLQGVQHQIDKSEALYPNGMVFHPMDFLTPTPLLGIVSLGALSGIYPITTILATVWPPDETVILLNALHIGLCTFILMSISGFCIFCLTKGDRHNRGWLLCGAVAGLSYTFESFTSQGQGIFWSNLVSGVGGLLLARFYPGRRSKFAAKWLAMVVASVVPFTFTRDFLPPLLCLTDSVSPLISSCVYPVLLSAYEGLCLPLIFWVWSSKSRRDCPQLALTFQLCLFNAFSEALFCGGLIQTVHRYPETQLPRYVCVAILSRCFGGKFLNRSGFWEYWSRCIWPNVMTAQRDLIGRHAHAQYLFSAVFLVLLAIAAFWILAFTAFTGRQVSTPFTKASCWCALLANALMSFVTELCVAALTFVQRRQYVGADASAQTFRQTFMAMHEAGMQPYSKTLRGIFGFGQASERGFEERIQEAAVTDTCHSVLGLTPKDMVIVAVVIFAYSTGPQMQAIGLIYDQAGSESCG